jgi:hypothetical protein
MPAHTTVLVSNICLGATEDDVYDTFESVLKGSKSVVSVGPMVGYTMVDGTERVATTVTIQGHPNVREKLHGLALYPKNPKVGFAYTEIVVQEKPLGYWSLEQLENPEFEYGNLLAKLSSRFDRR